MGRTFDDWDRWSLYEAASGKCEGCKKELHGIFEVDHIKPYSKGGKTILSNAQVLCVECNRKKGDMYRDAGQFPIELRFWQLRAYERWLSGGKNVLIVKNVIRSEMWRERIVRQTGKEVQFKKFREFVEAYPPEGLHTTIPMLIQICNTYNDMEAVALIADVEAGERGNPTGKNQYSDRGIDNNVHNSIQDDKPRVDTGNSTVRTMRRLAKDAPSLHERVVAGELSPNAAAVEAGFRAPKFQMSQDPEQAGTYLAERVDREWFEAMADAFYRSIKR